MTWYSGHAYWPNPHHRCERCGRNLGTRRQRLRGTKVPPAYITPEGEMLCERCFFDYLDTKHEATRKED